MNDSMKKRSNSEVVAVFIFSFIFSPAVHVAWYIGAVLFQQFLQTVILGYQSENKLRVHRIKHVYSAWSSLNFVEFLVVWMLS